jgi:branched-subunit amino acid aminotransferase/4-amino-4-deoxychorismate lyase
MSRRRHPVVEATLTRDDVLKADEVFLCNSLRGLLRVAVVDREI